MNTSTCIWNARGICIFDISKPGEQVYCYGRTCKDFEPKLTAIDYAEEP